MRREIDADTLLKEMVETLAQCDGDFIAEIANQVSSAHFEYLGDSQFEVTDAHEDDEGGDEEYGTDGSVLEDFADEHDLDLQTFIPDSGYEEED